MLASLTKCSHFVYNSELRVQRLWVTCFPVLEPVFKAYDSNLHVKLGGSSSNYKCN